MKFTSLSFKSLLKINKIVISIILLFIGIVFLLYRDFTPDDTFIHIGYAKDLYEGKGFSFAGNATYGSTSPLWPVLIGTLSLINADLVLSAKLFSLIFAIATIILMYYTISLRFDRVTSVCSLFLLSFNSYFLRWALTGMESSAACFFMLILIYVLLRENRGIIGNVLYLFIGLSPLVRPEFYIFIPVLFVFLYFTYPSKAFKTKFIFAILPALLWNCFALIYYGTIVPSTFLIKAGGSFFSTDLETLARSVKLILSGNSIELLFIFLTLIPLVKKATLKTIKSEYIVFIAWIFLFYSYYILKNVTILSRYSLMLLPAVILLTLFLLTTASESYKYSFRIRMSLLAVLVTASMLVHGLFTCNYVKPDADSFSTGFQREYRKIASILSETGKKESSVALSDVGIIGVYSGMKIYDFVGLVDKERFNYTSRTDYFAAKKPDYLITRGEVNREEFKNVNAEFHEIYAAHINSLGINKKEDIRVALYKVDWNDLH